MSALLWLIASQFGTTHALLRGRSSSWSGGNISLQQRDSATSSIKCCCKAIDADKSHEECNPSRLRLFHPKESKCCKPVENTFGCFFEPSYSEASKDMCLADTRLLAGDPQCCQVGSHTAFFVKQVLRRPKIHPGKLATSFKALSSVQINTDFVAGATFQGSFVEADAVIEHLRGMMQDPNDLLTCKTLRTSESNICEINSGSTSRCCCEHAQLWKGDQCIALSEPLDKVRFEGAMWKKLEQEEARCAEDGWRTVYEDRMEPVEVRYMARNGCERRVWKQGYGANAVLAAGASKWVTERYDCEKTRVEYQMKRREKRSCVKFVMHRFCPTEGTYYYRRYVPLGQCRSLDALVQIGNFGQSKCPRGEVEEGYRRQNGAKCKCQTSCK